MQLKSNERIKETTEMSDDAMEIENDLIDEIIMNTKARQLKKLRTNMGALAEANDSGKVS